MSNKLIESFLKYEEHRNSKTQETNPFNDAYELDEATTFRTKRSSGNEAVIKGKKWGITSRGTTVGRGGSSPEQARKALLRDASRTGSGIGSVEATRLRALAQRQKARSSGSSSKAAKPTQVPKAKTPNLQGSGQTPASGYVGPSAGIKVDTTDNARANATRNALSDIGTPRTATKVTPTSKIDTTDNARANATRNALSDIGTPRTATKVTPKKFSNAGKNEYSEFDAGANKAAVTRAAVRKTGSQYSEFGTGNQPTGKPGAGKPGEGAYEKPKMSAAKSELSKMYSAGREENKAPLTLPKFDQIRADAVKRKQNQSAIDQEFAGRQNVKDKATAAAAQDIADRQTSIPQNSVTGAQTKTQQVQDMIRGNTTPEQSTRNLNLPRINAAPQPKPEQQTPKSDSSILNPSGQREIPILTGDAARKRMGMDTNTGYSPPVQQSPSSSTQGLSLTPSQQGSSTPKASQGLSLTPSQQGSSSSTFPTRQVPPEGVFDTILKTLSGDTKSKMRKAEVAAGNLNAPKAYQSNASQGADMETNTDNIYNKKTARAVARAAAKAAAKKRKEALTDLQNFGGKL